MPSLDHLPPRHPRRSPVHRPLGGGGKSPLEIVGHGSKRGIGRPLQAEHTLDLSALSGVTLYEPEELVLSAKAGTPLAEIEALLAENGQDSPSSRWITAPLLGGVPRGKAARSAACSPPISPARGGSRPARRATTSSASTRVSGRGETFKSGGRVVKNVTGYDLSKLMAGSWGTLAVLTDVTFKVLPAAETETTLALRGLADEDAVGAMALAMGSSARGLGRGASAARRSPRASRAARSAPTRRPCCASKGSGRRSPSASRI